MIFKKISAVTLGFIVLCTVLSGCGLIDKTPRLDGSYELEAMGAKTVYTFDNKSDAVKIKYFIAGMEVYTQDGKYSINDEETEITLSISSDASAETGSEVPGELLSGTFTFERGDGYITIGNVKYAKSGISGK